MVKTIDVKMWLAGVFPVLSQNHKEMKKDRDIEKENLHKKLVEFVSMWRFCETALRASYGGDQMPKAIAWSNQMLASYREILMVEFDITDGEMLSPQDTMALLKAENE